MTNMRFKHENQIWSSSIRFDLARIFRKFSICRFQNLIKIQLMVLDWWFDLKFDKNQFPAENICSHQGDSQQVIDQKFIKSVVHDWANRDKKNEKNITRTANYYRNKGWYLCPSQSTCLQWSWCLSVCNWFGMDFKLIHSTSQPNPTQNQNSHLELGPFFSGTLDFFDVLKSYLNYISRRYRATT